MHAIARRAGFGACLATGALVTLAAQDGPTRITGNDLLNGLKNPTTLADVLGRLHGSASQPAHADHAAEREALAAQWTFQTDTALAAASRRRRSRSTA